MRPVLATLLLIAVLATGGLVAIDLTVLLTRSRDSSRSTIAADLPSNDVRVIHAFYEAANEKMAGSEDQVFSTIAMPRITLHRGGIAPQAGSDHIAAHFAALSRTGLLHFKIEQIVPEEQGYLVLLTVARASDSGVAASDRPFDANWTTTDRILINDGLIGEYWPGSVPMLALPPLPSLHVAQIPLDPVSALSRLELAPGGVMRALDIPATQLLVVESGAISLESSGNLLISNAGAPWREVPFGEDQVVQPSLVPGDAVLVPVNGLQFSNTRPEPASLLSVLVISRTHLYGPKHALSEDLLVSVAMHDPNRATSSSTWASGVTSTPLSIAALPTSATSLNLSGRSVSIAPGQLCDTCARTSPAFVIVTAGLLDMTSVSTSATGATPEPQGHLLWAGNATTLDRGSPVTLENAGSSQLVLSLIDLAPGSPPATPHNP